MASHQWDPRTACANNTSTNLHCRVLRWKEILCALVKQSNKAVGVGAAAAVVAVVAVVAAAVAAAAAAVQEKKGGKRTTRRTPMHRHTNTNQTRMLARQLMAAMKRIQTQRLPPPLPLPPPSPPPPLP